MILIVQLNGLPKILLSVMKGLGWHAKNFTFSNLNFYIKPLNGAWVFQSGKWPTLGFSSRHDFTGHEIKPCIWLPSQCEVCLKILPLCPSPKFLSLSLSQISRFVLPQLPLSQINLFKNSRCTIHWLIEFN